MHSSCNYWTNFVQNPFLNNWKPIPTTPGATWVGWIVANNPDAKPWLNTASDDELSDKRIAWDEVYFNAGAFTPASTRHQRGPNGGTGSNILYGDGHADWIGFEEMFPVVQSGQYTNYY
ncbi:MAG: hypothetical protein R3C45_07280 [Phycisphaerales bacterium]